MSSRAERQPERESELPDALKSFITLLKYQFVSEILHCLLGIDTKYFSIFSKNFLDLLSVPEKLLERRCEGLGFFAMLGDVGLVQDVVKGEVLVDSRGQSFQVGPAIS